MRAWPSVDVPVLPGRGGERPVMVHDTRTGGLSPVGSDGVARLYVCGITPYDATHLGHAATYVAFDLLNRTWRDAGLSVQYVQNVTDVDDPLLERALVTGQQWTDLATREINLFREDMEALRVLPPDHYVGAVESIPLDIVAIQRLEDSGAVYAVDGDLYFEVHHDASFGSVAALPEDEMLRIFAERGGDPDRRGKRHPLDCLLWQAEKPGDPAWDSPFGRGRPGWHIECSSIAVEYLGGEIDVQGGGRDLAFPHHEMSASEAQVAHPGRSFARTFVHTGMVGYEGEKMSKSRGNLVFVSRLRRSGTEPMVIRMALLSRHYRADWEWTDEVLKQAEERLADWRSGLASLSRSDAEELVGHVRGALRNDLDGPAALAAVDQVISGSSGDGTGADLARHAVDALLGVSL
jgi:L-cysteine:1D-myo-inositol 2-amino-2-deoxy-alpha-D-glucopyranoside ligase